MRMARARVAMPVQGQSQKSARTNAMSGPPPLATK